MTDEPAPQKTAQELFHEARALVDEGDYPAAIAGFNAAMDAPDMQDSGRPNTMLNLATLHMFTGAYDQAMYWYSSYLCTPKGTDNPLRPKILEAFLNCYLNQPGNLTFDDLGY